MRRVQVDDQLAAIPSNALVELCQDARNADNPSDQFCAASLFSTAAQGALADTALQPEDLDTFAELQALVADATVLRQTAIDTLAELNAIVGDATIVDTADARLGAAVAPGQGFLDGASVLHHSSVVKEGDFFKTSIYIDLTDLKSTTTLLDIIGEIGPDIAVNGAMAADTDWTKGADWTIAAGVATAAPGAGTVLEPAAALVPVAGETYEVTYAMSGFVAGTCTFSMGGTAGAARGSDATFTERVKCVDGTNLKFTSDAAADYDIDNVTVKLVSPAHIGQITAAVNGTLFRGTVTCLEAPVTGVTDIDLYSSAAADLNDLLYDNDGSAGTEQVLHAHGGAWAADINVRVDLSLLPAADEYLFLVNGAAGTVGTYTAGKFLLELWGV